MKPTNASTPQTKTPTLIALLADLLVGINHIQSMLTKDSSFDDRTLDVGGSQPA